MNIGAGVPPFESGPDEKVEYGAVVPDIHRLESQWAAAFIEEVLNVREIGWCGAMRGADQRE